MNNFNVGNAYLSKMQSLSESREGSRVTKLSLVIVQTTELRDGPLENSMGGGGGGGEFSSSMNFFSLMFPLNEYFFRHHVVHEYFFFLEVTLN